MAPESRCTTVTLKGRIYLYLSQEHGFGRFWLHCEGPDDPCFSLTHVTGAYVPRDAVIYPLVALDVWMLVVAVLLSVKLKVEGGFYQGQVGLAIEAVESEELQNAL